MTDRLPAKTPGGFVSQHNYFHKFIISNKEKVCGIAEANCTRNADGKVVITKDDPWREEIEWNSFI